jgi:hypothetical protein
VPWRTEVARPLVQPNRRLIAQASRIVCTAERDRMQFGLQVLTAVTMKRTTVYVIRRVVW